MAEEIVPQAMPQRVRRPAGASVLLHFHPGEAQPSREALKALADAVEPHVQSIGVTVEFAAGTQGGAITDVLVANRRLRILAANILPHMNVERRIDPALPLDTVEVSFSTAPRP